MGYVNNTSMSEFIPPAAVGKSAGTWTPGVSSNVAAETRTAGDASFKLLIPAVLPGNSRTKAGAKLKSMDVFYKIATAAADDFATVALHRMSLPVTGSAVSGEEVALTIDAGHDSAAERKAVGDHTLTVTLSTPAYLNDGDAYVLECTIDAAATTVFTLYGARMNYELRV